MLSLENDLIVESEDRVGESTTQSTSVAWTLCDREEYITT